MLENVANLLFFCNKHTLLTTDEIIRDKIDPMHKQDIIRSNIPFEHYFYELRFKNIYLRIKKDYKIKKQKTLRHIAFYNFIIIFIIIGITFNKFLHWFSATSPTYEIYTEEPTTGRDGMLNVCRIVAPSFRTHLRHIPLEVTM